MPKRLRRCKECGEYTLRTDKCPHCGGELEVPHPHRFSPEDPYGEYRRRMKRRVWEKKFGSPAGGSSE
ncbi:MAG: RNA-protein complex protein Nop10 [Methanopyri archaeon]|nr:RNA-protein complex protein Nop10 [Methanopyri archaeon]